MKNTKIGCFCRKCSKCRKQIVGHRNSMDRVLEQLLKAAKKSSLSGTN